MRKTGMELAWGWVALSRSPLPQGEHPSDHLGYLETQFLKMKNGHLSGSSPSLPQGCQWKSTFLRSPVTSAKASWELAAGQGSSSVLKVPIVQAWGPESDLQCPCKSQSLRHTSVIPALGWWVWRQAYSLAELVVSYRFGERPYLNKIRWRMIKM